MQILISPVLGRRGVREGWETGGMGRRVNRGGLWGRMAAAVGRSAARTMLEARNEPRVPARDCPARRESVTNDGLVRKTGDASGPGDGDDAAAPAGDQAAATAQCRARRLYRGRARTQPAARTRRGFRPRRAPKSRPASPFEAPAAHEPDAHWASQELETDAGALAQNLGTELDNAFGPDRAPTPAEHARPPEGHGLSATSWSGVAGGGAGALAPNLEAYAAAADQPRRPSRPAGGDRPERSGRHDDRPRADRRARRGRLSHGIARRARRPPRRLARPGRIRCWRACASSSRPACSRAILPNAWRCN